MSTSDPLLLPLSLEDCQKSLVMSRLVEEESVSAWAEEVEFCILYFCNSDRFSK